MSRVIPTTNTGPGGVFLLLDGLARDVRPCAQFVSLLQSNSKTLGAFAGPPPDSHRADAIRAQQNDPCPPDMLLRAESRHDHGLEPFTIRPSYLLGSRHARVWTQLIHSLIAKIWTMARKFWLSFSKRVASLRMSFMVQKKR